VSRFEDYEKVTDPLVLPIRGKEYIIPEVSLSDGLRFTAMQEDPEGPKLSDEEFLHMFLGTAYDEMVADDVPAAAILRASATAFADFQRGRATAEIIWATGGDPKAVTAYLTPNRATRRASQRSTGTGSARKTPSPASTSSTKTSPTNL